MKEATHDDDDTGAETPLVRYEQHGAVAVITMNDPKRLNVIAHGPGTMAEALLEALGRAEADPGIGCIVLTGEGRAFSAGGDVAGLNIETAYDYYAFLAGNVLETDRIRGLETPTIGAINGICYGFAFILATHLDMLVAGESARFGLLETRFGSTGAQTLPYVVGAQWAKFLALTGELIGARKAQEIGIVLEVVPDEILLERTMDLGRRVAAMPREAVTLNRKVINHAIDLMGWNHQRDFGLALNTVTNQMSKHARAADGRVLTEVMKTEGWKAYKEARDAAFEPPWLA